MTDGIPLGSSVSAIWCGSIARLFLCFDIALSPIRMRMEQCFVKSEQMRTISDMKAFTHARFPVGFAGYREGHLSGVWEEFWQKEQTHGSGDGF